MWDTGKKDSIIVLMETGALKWLNFLFIYSVKARTGDLKAKFSQYEGPSTNKYQQEVWKKAGLRTCEAILRMWTPFWDQISHVSCQRRAGNGVTPTGQEVPANFNPSMRSDVQHSILESVGLVMLAACRTLLSAFGTLSMYFSQHVFLFKSRQGISLAFFYHVRHNVALVEVQKQINSRGLGVHL